MFYNVFVPTESMKSQFLCGCIYLLAFFFFCNGCCTALRAICWLKPASPLARLRTRDFPVTMLSPDDIQKLWKDYDPAEEDEITNPLHANYHERWGGNIFHPVTLERVPSMKGCGFEQRRRRWKQMSAPPKMEIKLDPKRSARENI